MKKYRVVLLRNGEYKKTLHVSRTLNTAYVNFNRIKEKNNVLFPKKFINTGKIKPVEYTLCITKVTEEGDVFRKLRDKYGKLYIEKPLGDWTILHSADYQLEEKFWLFGMDSKAERPTITEIVKRLMKGAYSKTMVKQIITLHNKLIIYNEDQFDMVICKCEEDAKRLQKTLAKIAKKQKIKSLLFMGAATSGLMISRLHDLIKEKTGWSLIKIMRVTTRP